MPSFRLTSVLLALLAIGCRDSSAPRPSLAISLTNSTPYHDETETANGLTMSCSVTLTAIATGTGTATWQDGVVRYYLGDSRTVPVDSQTFTIADVRSAWGTTITQNERPQSNWSFTASVPFDVELELRYATEGSAAIAATKVRFACGPRAPSGTYAVPVVRQLDVTPTTGELQAGGGIDVTYVATSDYPLWSTTVVASGPFLLRRTVAENGATSVTRTVHFDVPGGAVKNTPIGITVTAEDGALQEGRRSVQTQTVVVDRTPPVLSSVLNVAASTFAGQFAVGDSLRLMVTASDNDQVDWLVWELGAPANVRDSLPAPPRTTATTWNVALPVKPEWVGAPIMSLYVRDAAGLRSNVVSSVQDSVRFFPLVTHPTSAPAVATPKVGVLQFGDIAFDVKRNVFYLVAYGTSEIAVLDVATMTFRTPIPVPSSPVGLDLTLSGDSLIAGLPNDRSLAVVNLSQPATPASVVRLSALDSAGLGPSMAVSMMVRVAANGRVLVTLPRMTLGGDQILTMDLKTGAQTIRVDARSPDPYGVSNAGSSPDRSRIVMYDLRCPRSYAAATDTFTPCGEWPQFSMMQPVISRGFTFDAAGQRLSLANSVFDLDFHLLRAAPAINGRLPYSALSPDGTVLYLGADQTVTAMRISDGVFTERFNVPIPAQRLFVSPAGDWLMVFKNDSGVQATRVDLR